MVIPMKRIISILFIVCIFLQGCSSQDISSESQQFQDLCNDLFVESTSSNALTLNYTLSHPEKCGIALHAGGFTPLSPSENPESHSALLCKLENISSQKLSASEKILYDSLRETLVMSDKLSAFRHFERPISPVSGIQAQLPILLAEYRIDSTADVDNYFKLLASIPGYFSSLVDWMHKQASIGCLPSKQTLKKCASQCQDYVTSNGRTILIQSFSKKIKKWQSDSALCREYFSQNKTLIDQQVIPAYINLYSSLEDLAKGSCSTGSLADCPNGKQYYELLFAHETSTAQPLTQYIKELNQKLHSSRQKLLDLASSKPELFSSVTQKCLARGNKNPKLQLQHLSQAISSDFPSVSNIDYSVYYVDPCLEKYLSPAFYLTPPLDDFRNNTIYINNSPRFKGSDLSTTLAHEGYPGHLLQNVYFRSQDRPLLAYCLDFNGYTEGWATYAENYATKYMGFTEDEQSLLKYSNIESLCTYALCDIGIHYQGWNLTRTYSFLKKSGACDKKTAQIIYQTILDEPGSYLKYTIGYFEFEKLKKKAQEKWGKDYSDKKFHTYVLSTGPTTFSILEKYLDVN